ncbi:MAG: helix-turn-helix domain-containing protein [Candidatus Accumulibacter sp.]|uniref:helix-turn-helix domain-containing protein n=1 Tax=Accumulibacter sp. TaxID=2053492 RepID=UPI0025E72876|nr:helix-turn-helix domain-containing protein [Accumulibacter sp.]MCM8600059.1 helix-turn-helix domain-containing protein [Accumulibacter sp.]
MSTENHDRLPLVTGQCAEVLQVIRERQPVPSFELTANLAIPEAAARVHDLRTKGFNILTVIQSEFEFRGVIRRNVALYSMGSPEWPAPGFLVGQGGGE